MGLRLHRTAQLGLLARDMAGVGCRRTGPERTRAVQRLARRLGRMHGLPQKIGQLLAFSDIEQSDAAFAPLTENEPSMPASAAFAALERELAQPIARHFYSLEEEGIAASIGQVHRGVLLDGREVAVKIQYPEVAGQISWDLRSLGWLCAPVGDLRRDFDLGAYRHEIGSMLEAELNYEIEAQHLIEFARRTQEWTDLVLPAVIPQLSGPRVLTTTWLDGERLSQTRRWTSDQRAQAAAIILKFFLTGVFQWRAVHADPHPGNYRFLREGSRIRIGVLDFGCVKALEPRFVAGLAGLIHDRLHGANDPGKTWQHFLNLGFNPTTLAPMKEQLTAVARILAEPFTAAGPFDVATWRLSARLCDLLGPHRLAFRLAGPPEMTYFLRAFQGVVQYLKLLRAPIGWREQFLAVSAERNDFAPALEREAAPGPAVVELKSNILHIQVTENAQVRVALSFTAAATDNLEMLVPDEIHGRLRERCIDLASIIAAAQARHYAPGELFSLDYDNKRVRVWLA